MVNEAPRTRIVRTTNNKYSGSGEAARNEKCKTCNSFLGSNSLYCKRGFEWARVTTNPCFRPMKFVGTVVDEAAEGVTA